MEDRLLHALAAWRAHPPTASEVARFQNELAARMLADIQAIVPKPPAQRRAATAAAGYSKVRTFEGAKVQHQNRNRVQRVELPLHFPLSAPTTRMESAHAEVPP